jgi:hypothetical protein
MDSRFLLGWREGQGASSFLYPEVPLATVNRFVGL